MSIGSDILMRMFGRPRGLLGRLRDISRVLTHDGQVGQPREGVPELIAAAGFSDFRFVDTEKAFCLLASRAT